MSSAGHAAGAQGFGNVIDHGRHLAVAGGGAEGDQPRVNFPRLAVMRRILGRGRSKRHGGGEKNGHQPGPGKTHDTPSPLRVQG